MNTVVFNLRQIKRRGLFLGYPVDDKGVCELFLAAIERNSDLNLFESGASDKFKKKKV